MIKSPPTDNPSVGSLWRRRFRLTEVGFPHWALDAPHRLTYPSSRSGRWQAYCEDLVTGVDRQVTNTKIGITSATIDPSGRWIWWFEDAAGDEVGTWQMAPFEGGPPWLVPLAPAHPAGLALGRRVAVVGRCTGDQVDISVLRPGAAPRSIYAHLGLAQVAGLSTDATLLCIQHSEDGSSLSSALRVVDLAGRPVAEKRGGRELALQAGSWSPVRGDARLLVHHEQRGIRRPGVWSPVRNHWLPIEMDLPGEVDAEWYPTADQLLLRHQWAGRTQLYRWDMAAGSLTSMDLPTGTAEVARVRPDGAVWSLHSSGGCPTELLSNGRPLRAPAHTDLGGEPYSDLWAGRVHCLVACPPGPRPHPAILILHGGPARHDMDVFSARVQAWVDHGFAVVLVNYRGSTGYGRAWRDVLQRGPGPGLSELEDLAMVRDRLIAVGIADPRRIVLEGGSWGGYLTLLAIGLQPTKWSLGIAVVPIADWAAAYEDEMEPIRAHDRALFGGTPRERPKYYAERSPITFVRNIQVPVLIVAGKHDPRCPHRQIRNYVRQLEAYGKAYELHEFDAGHGSLDIHEQILQQELQLGFASRYLGTSAPLPEPLGGLT